MMVIRPITVDDEEALWRIAQQTGIGFTSLQPERAVITDKLARALAAFDDQPPEEAFYLFVLEDTAANQVVGVCGIESAVGLSAPWYNYTINQHVHASKELGVYTSVDTLTLCNDHTGCSELCTLFLQADYRHSRNGHLLAKSRLLFVVQQAQRFSKTLVAELRGYMDASGQLPFWEGLGRHFLAVDFVAADRQTVRDKAFIAELMPRYPIYVNLLPAAAQAAIAQTHKEALPARKLLESEGLRYTGYVDIFDGGPLLEAPIKTIRAVRESRLYNVNVQADRSLASARTMPWLIANTQCRGFRCIMGPALLTAETITITPQQAAALNVDAGARLRAVSLIR